MTVTEKLEKLEAPKPRAEARLAARNAALVEFARVQSNNPPQEQPTPEQVARQGFWSRFRLSRNETRHGGPGMKWGLFGRSAFGAVASGCVAAFALMVMWPMFRNSDLRGSATVEQYEPTVDLKRSEQKKDQPLVAQQENGARHVQIQERTDELSRLSAPKSEAISPPPPLPELSATPVVADASTPSQVNYAVAPAPAESEIDPANLRLGARAPDARAKLASGFAQGGLANIPPPVIEPYFEASGDDKFQHFEINPIKRVIGADAVSTFSVDVDTASYSFARRMINEGRLPQKDAVRVEEMLNYFDYAWPKPESRKTPFAATIAVSDSPWTKGKKLVHIGIKGYDIDRNEAPDANLVFLIDVSGSMNSPDKLPLAVQSMKLLLQRLKPTDTVGIVVYAGAAGTVLEPTAVKNEDKILKALDSLQAGGSTAGAEGIELAYQLAEKNFRKGAVNRVMLATDGDFNVGIDNTEELKSFIERKREKGIFLSVLGFGEGNYRDELAQALAQNGNGVAAYIDTIAEAKKVLVEQSTGSLFTIAKDVKLQVEFNPRTVAEYRLVGYETRALKREDFNNDKIDAGDVGAGHTVTALYEITPVGSSAVSVDALRYQSEGAADKGDKSGSRNEYGFLKIRYKLPNEDASTLVTQPIPLETPALSAVIQREVGFSTAVAGFAQLLKGGTYTGKLGYEDVIEQAQKSRGEDRNGYRAEFIELVRKASKAKGM